MAVSSKEQKTPRSKQEGQGMYLYLVEVQDESPTTVLKAQSFSRLSNLSSSYLLVSILNSWIPLLKDDHIRQAALRQLKTNTL
ncbi:hypothetical protein PCASD_08247 [Puccinia coronata f. sp. avenae]|uniref:Uncharacterized protein n=1 Tax=Puccinia coronata f. sp. avenae TaxID=200324 RepID=A0A2N5ULK7_9BASI|nr:hypothetical protein PCASD_08247 [Puccinia coronata f. sp. avenae]